MTWNKWRQEILDAANQRRARLELAPLSRRHIQHAVCIVRRNRLDVSDETLRLAGFNGHRTAA